MQVSMNASSAASSAGSTSTNYSSTQTNTATSSSTDPSSFMQLLMAQLTHQNPLEPMDDSQMMSQMAQLNSLQELQTIKLAIQEMASSNLASYASSLVGKTVRAEYDGETYQGKVNGVTLSGGKISVHIGDDVVPLDTIMEIQEEQA